MGCLSEQVITADTIAHGVVTSDNVLIETYPAQPGVAVSVLNDKNTLGWFKFVDKHFGPQPFLAAFLQGWAADCDAIAHNSTLLKRLEVGWPLQMLAHWDRLSEFGCEC